MLGHVGDGNFHQCVLYNPEDEAETAAVRKCVHDMLDRALEMEGTSSVRLFTSHQYDHVLAFLGRTRNRSREEGE